MDLDFETRASEPLTYVDPGPRTYYSRETMEMMKQTFGIDPTCPDRDAYQCATHIAATVNRRARNKAIEDCMAALKNIEYDTFAFQGASGIGISLILAHLLQKETILVRKDGEPRQADARYKVEGYKEAKRYIVVDDLISTGMTAARVIQGVHSLAPEAELVGILLYYEGASLMTEADHNYRWKHILRLSGLPGGKQCAVKIVTDAVRSKMIAALAVPMEPKTVTTVTAPEKSV